jgi:serine/threonine-protein kinase SRPK3
MQADTTVTRDPQLVYQWLDDVEKLEGYATGGYHPIHLGDELSQGRYRIVHKLGFGSYSTGK